MPSFIEEQLTLCVEEDDSDWRTWIVKYLKYHILPLDPIAKIKILKQAERCSLFDGELIRQCFSHSATKYLSKEEGDYTLREVHEVFATFMP